VLVMAEGRSRAGSQIVSGARLDSPDYSPIVHLNALFPNSANLSHIDAIVDYVDLFRSNLALAGKKNVESYDTKAVHKIIQTCEEVVTLSENVEALRTGAENTDQDIKNMTQDIKNLDNTKSNLIQSITVLKRLQMLTTAYSQLAALVSRRQYKEMAQTLAAVMELMTHFRQFRSISQIATLSKQVADLQTGISDQIFSEFVAVIESKDTTIANEVGPSLADGCIVLDNLPGSDWRSKLVVWYCNVQLKEYRTIFHSNDEAGSLENISRRYAYLKRLVNTHSEELARYFTPKWKVTEELCKSFCVTTRQDISNLLSRVGQDIDVQLLLTALNETLEFEQYLEKRFPGQSFANAISGAFQPHLHIWIQHQDKILWTKFQQYKAPPPRAGESEESRTVIPSSADLFIFYRQVLTQTAKLSTGEPLLDLANLFGKWLTTYCNQILRGMIPDKIVSTEDIGTACLILSTADYCFTTTAQLEQRLVDQIDQQFKENVDLEKEKGLFLEIINTLISRLVGKVEVGCEFAWREMLNTNWVRLETVGDQSSYVGDLKDNIHKDTQIILDNMNKELYCRMICDKIVESITSTFLFNVVRCRPISEVSAEQMLLDLYVLKGIFLKLPSLKQQPEDGNSDPPLAYTRHVTKSLARVETILKVILTQSEPAEGLIQNYFYLVGDRSAANFTKILELKGILKNTQTRFLEMFNSHLKAHDDLVDESPILSGLQIRASSAKTGPVIHQNGHHMLEPKVLAGSLLSKEGFERFAHGAEAPVTKINENFRNIGRLFRRDGAGSPLGR
jgi:hypothetical protein